MPLGIAILCFIIWAVLKIVILSPQDEMRRKQRKEFKEKMLNGYNIKLEYELFCKHRDKMFEENEEKINLVNAKYGNYIFCNRTTREPWGELDTLYRKALIDSRKELRERGYVHGINEMPIHAMVNDEHVIEMLLANYDKSVDYGFCSTMTKYHDYRTRNDYGEYIGKKQLGCINEHPEYQKYVKPRSKVETFTGYGCTNSEYLPYSSR